MVVVVGGGECSSLTNLLKLGNPELSRHFFFFFVRRKEGYVCVCRINMGQTALHKGTPGGRLGRTAPAPPPAAN